MASMDPYGTMASDVASPFSSLFTTCLLIICTCNVLYIQRFRPQALDHRWSVVVCVCVGGGGGIRGYIVRQI